MAKQDTKKTAPKAKAPKKEEVKVVATPKKETKKVAKVDAKKVSQSTDKVSFKWSTGKRSGQTEVMSENMAEIMEGKGLGKKGK